MRRYPILNAIIFVVAVALVPAIPMEAQDGPIHTDGDTVARPRRPASDPNTPPDQAPIPSKLSPKNRTPEEDASANFKVDTNLVTIDVSVLDNRGNFIPNIPRGNFRILEDNVPQQVKSFNLGEAPMTVCLLIEFSNKYQWYGSPAWYQTLTAAYGFVQTLKKEDYVAVIAYDMRPEILSDFSQDRMKTQQALSRLRIAGFSEANLFDALVDTEERMKDIEGRKAIILLSSGVDTFSKLTFDKARKAIQEDAIPIYAIGLMQALRIMAEGRGMGAIQEMTFLQADNEMKTFARETGGMSFFPRFYGEFPSIFQQIQQSLRNQYSIGYSPSNAAHDGKFRKIKVELVNPQGEAFRITDEKGKPIKYQIVAKAGYTAPRTVE
jgi:VWFA-related protein